ncbi:hypothetical protein MTYP_01671 [Methylophilaceae bacterium]|nr:hypothetical protein MTYP_01671 [Methylophilaceae bacterium]
MGCNVATTKEKSLNDAQIQSLKIKKLIFHIINVEAEETQRVKELDELVLDEEQNKFFLERIKSVASGIQYNFLEHAEHTQAPCKQLLSNEKEFRTNSLILTQAFASYHKKNMASGVFVVAIVESMYTEKESINLVFLAKFDHRNVYQIVVKANEGGVGNHAVMQKVADTLVEDKSAIQKSALINLDNDKYDWDVLADERRLNVNGEITDYFRDFLGVSLREVASVLTKRAVQVVHQWAIAQVPTDLPNGEEKGNYRSRAVAYMESNTVFDIDDYLNAVIRDEEDGTRKLRMEQSLRNQLDEAGIANQKFQTRPNSLPKKLKKQQWKTDEGITLEFYGEARDLGIETKPRSDGVSGQEIVIKTRGYKTV